MFRVIFGRQIIFIYAEFYAPPVTPHPGDASAKTDSLTIWNDLPYEFIDKAVVLFRNIFNAQLHASLEKSER